jgi:hypothetical protein
MAQTAAVIGLSAQGPQEEYLFTKDNDWKPSIRQCTHFTKFHRTTYPNFNQFVGKTVEFTFDPKTMGDMMHNVYLTVTLPQLPQISGQTYIWTPQIGRAIIEHVEFRIGPNIVENIDDNWYIVRDQLFLDADEKLAMYRATNGGQNETQSASCTQDLTLIIPLDFFFCRKHGDNELVERPPLPLCAMKEKFSIKFFFRPQSWFTNYPNPIEFTDVTVLTEEVLLTREEKQYYLSTPLKYVINRSWTNPNITFSGGVATQNFTANFPITMVTWFIRKNAYTDTSNVAYRYSFGYYSPYSTATGPLVYFNGTTVNYIDTILNCDIYLNGIDLTGQFANGPFYQYKQPLEHKMSVPQNSIYLYCFGNSPKYYNQGGYLNFENINSATSKINIGFQSKYIADIQSNYTLYIYYYGYQILEFTNGISFMFYK